MKQRFSSASATYDQYAQPQRILAQRVVESISLSEKPARILELGAGTGLLTQMLLNRFPKAQIDALDLAEGMVEHGQKKLHAVRWMVGDAQTWKAPHTYSLLASSAALHWVEDLSATFAHLYSLLQPGGHFALGMMLDGTLEELHALRQEIAPHKRPAQKLPTAQKVLQSLDAAGFKVLQKQEMRDKIYYPSASDFLRALHEQGVTGGALGMGSQPLNRTELRQLTQTYQNRFSTSDGVIATYHTTTLWPQCR